MCRILLGILTKRFIVLLHVKRETCATSWKWWISSLFEKITLKLNSINQSNHAERKERLNGGWSLISWCSRNAWLKCDEFMFENTTYFETQTFIRAHSHSRTFEIFLSPCRPRTKMSARKRFQIGNIWPFFFLTLKTTHVHSLINLDTHTHHIWYVIEACDESNVSTYNVNVR